VATATAAIVVVTPANFYHFRRPKLNFQPLSFTFETFGKKLAETKIVARVNEKKIKAKKLKKRLLNHLRRSSNDFLPKLVNNGESLRFFWPLLRLCWNAMSKKHIFLMSCLNRFRSIFLKKYNFLCYSTLWQYLLFSIWFWMQLVPRLSCDVLSRNGRLGPIRVHGSLLPLLFMHLVIQLLITSC